MEDGAPPAGRTPKALPPPALPPGQRKQGRSSTRGADTNASGRYETHAREAFADGWWQEPDTHETRTSVTPEKVRTALSWNDSPDLHFDRAINPYRGCEHGCAYCYARPNHAYVGLSPGLDFETRLFAKTNIVDALERELAAPGYTAAPIMLSGVTDCYQPIERTWRLTRGVIELLGACRHPFSLITKSGLVCRDLDLLAPLAQTGLARVAISITTLDPMLHRDLEPRAASPARRLESVRLLAQAGIPVSVMAAPMMPGINDHELEAILGAASAAGAQSAGYILLRLPLEVAPLWQEWLDRHRPQRAKRALNKIAQAHGGKVYRSAFGVRQRGEGAHADLLAHRFAMACRRFGLQTRRAQLDCSQFRRPVPKGGQLGLFEDAFLGPD